jgi:hypothetical protein
MCKLADSKTGFNIFEAAVHADRDCESFKLRLRFEYDRLQKWGEITGLARLKQIQESDKDAKKEAVKYEREYQSQLGHRGPLVTAALSELNLLLKHLRKTELVYDSIVNSAAGSKSSQHNGTVDSQSADELRNADLSDPSTHPLAAMSKDLITEDVVDDEEQLAFVQVLGQQDGPKESRKHPRGLNHIMTGLSGIGKVTKQPKRFKWAVRDKDKFSEKIVRVRQIVDYLQESLRGDQMEILVESMKTFRLMQLQLAGSMDQVKALLQAERMSSTASLDGVTLVQNDSSNGAALAIDAENANDQFNVFWRAAAQFAIDMNAPKPDMVEPFKLKNSEIPDKVFFGKREIDGRSIARSRAGRDVWIEWKPYTTALGQDGRRSIPEDTIQRIEKLVALLRAPGKPIEFCVPTCNGYFVNSTGPDSGEFGLVFEPPTSASRPDGWPPRSLLACFKDERIAFSERIAIARQLSQWVLYLHAINWLHKGLRSATVLFFPEDGAGLGTPWVSGFEYSRIARGGVTTAGPPNTGDRILYIHPDYLGHKAQYGFRKTYDMYSLGIILVEIAYWKPISEILGFSKPAQESNGAHSGRFHSGDNPMRDDAGQATAGAQSSEPDAAAAQRTLAPPQHQPAKYPISKVERIRNRILNGEVEVLTYIREHMGDKYLNATQACLEGLQAFKLSEDHDQSNPQIAAMLQQGFVKVVVDSLKAINV